jgi:hypothetical protein
VLVQGDSKNGKIGGWFEAHNINYLTGTARDGRWSEWLDAVSDLGPALWHLIGARLDAALKKTGVKSGGRVIWLPTGALGILPLGIAQDPATKRRLVDSYEIVRAQPQGARLRAKGDPRERAREVGCHRQPHGRPCGHREGRQGRGVALSS